MRLRAAGGAAEFCRCDVSDWDSVRDMVDKTADAFGGLMFCAPMPAHFHKPK